MFREIRDKRDNPGSKRMKKRTIKEIEGVKG